MHADTHTHTPTHPHPHTHTATRTLSLYAACIYYVVVNLSEISTCFRYGWTTLHYASTEGHLPIVKLLVELHVSVNERDQDGTTAAYRAQVNGHEDVVTFLLQHGSEDELLNVDEDGFDPTDPVADMYAKVFKVDKKKRSGSEGNVLDQIPDYSSFVSTHVNGKSSKPCRPEMFASAPGGLNRNSSDPGGFTEMGAPQAKSANRNSMFVRSNTLPSSKPKHPRPPVKKDTIRRLIRKELEATFGSDYEKPTDVSKTSIMEEDTQAFDGIGVQTLTGLMREEFEKYKVQKEQEEVASYLLPPKHNTDDAEFEDLYASIANLPRAPSPPSPPGAPPLPPRNHPMMIKNNDSSQPHPGVSALSLQLTNENPPNTLLDESFKKLAPKLGKDWKKLVHALHLETTPKRINERIAVIQKQHPDSATKQAAAALSEWRKNKGRGADVDSLIIALRRCGLNTIISEVEKVTQEFTA